MIAEIIIVFFCIVVFSFVAALIECEYEAYKRSKGFYYVQGGWRKL